MVILLIFNSSLAATNNSTEGVLTTLHHYSQEALEIGKLGKMKLVDMQIKAFNERMLEDHQVSSEAIEDAAKHLNIDIKTKIRQDDEADKLNKLSGKQFADQYLQSMEELHLKMQRSFQKDIEGRTIQPLKGMLEGHLARVNSILGNLRALDSAVPKPN